MHKNKTARVIEERIRNGYAETHVGYHADWRFWNGEFRRGAYAQIAAPHGGTKRIYASSYASLLSMLDEEV